MRGAIAAYLAVVGAAVVVFLTLELPPVVTQQTGYRGTAMEQVHTVKAVRAQAAANVARSLGGRLTARNRAEGGAEVEIRLPLAALSPRRGGKEAPDGGR